MTRNFKNKKKVFVPKTRWQKWKARARRAENLALGKAVALGHATYYSLVAYEAHGHYRYAAGALLLFMVLEFMSGTTGEGE